ncbi:hypothetical protein BLNAU_2479 [Blattamonas nauphoetae]|uniref:Uncharacterized protein n=1 Tax=Blattamonas nauphoetae TaxID=2049346 RepID=A0ABQ9YG78_9EUKA|nr:hypothetical protein BLNAU_2479 [Blattamonas nauphoetae]
MNLFKDVRQKTEQRAIQSNFERDTMPRSDDEDDDEEIDDDEEDGDDEEDDEDDDDDDDDEDEEDEEDDEDEDDEGEEEEEDDEYEKSVRRKGKDNDKQKGKPGNALAALAMTGTTISANGVHVKDISKTVVEIVEVGNTGSTGTTAMHLRIKSVDNPQCVVDVKIDESNGCTIQLGPSSDDGGLFSSQPQGGLDDLQFTRPPPPRSFQFDRSKNLSAQMAELLHSDPFT